MISLKWEDIYRLVKELPPGRYYGVPRGGAIVAGLTGNATENALDCDYIIDDIIDSGKTKAHYQKLYPNKEFLGLIDRVGLGSNKWVHFPWEKEGDIELEDNVLRILQGVNQDTDREGLIDTPKRHIKYLKEFLTPPSFKLTTFKNEGIDEMIVQKDINFYSICEHHLLPFFGVGCIAYIPKDRIVGLSKLARTLDKFSRRLQNQERITQDVANFLMDELEAEGVGVILKARHLCMEMRGVKSLTSQTYTSCLKGCFLTDSRVRSEFLNMYKI